jgi:hypothetical protein
MDAPRFIAFLKQLYRDAVRGTPGAVLGRWITLGASGACMLTLGARPDEVHGLRRASQTGSM